MWIARLVVATAAIAAGSPVEASTLACAKGSILPFHLPAGVEITGSTVVPPAAPGTVRPSASRPPLPVALPSYCKISGVINSRVGAAGRTYGVRFELAMPDGWNGRLLFQGGGGT